MKQLFPLFEHFKIVRKIPIFEKLNWFEVRRIASRAHISSFKKGDIIYRQGEPASGFFCILSGRVQAYFEDDGQRSDVEFFRRGMYFGIISSLTGKPHSMTFEAMNDSQILHIPKKEFSSIMRSVPQLGMEFSQDLSKRLQDRSSREKKKALHKIIAVYSCARRTGNSTYAFHLAHQISLQANAKVVMVRVTCALPTENPSDHSSKGTEATPQWKDVPATHLDEILGDDEKIRTMIHQSDYGADLLNASFYPDDKRLVLQMSEFITTLAVDYDYVVVDLPTDQDGVVLKTLTQSDEVHLLVHDSIDELHMLHRLLDHLEEKMRDKFYAQHIRVILKTQQDVAPMPFKEIRDILDYDIYGRLPFVTEDQLHDTKDFGPLWVRFPRPRSIFGKEMIKIAREISGVRIGLVLGGGAALGVAHIGVLKVFEREGIPVDVLAGSSMGALVSALWATGYDAQSLEEIAQQFRDQRAMLKLFDPVIPISGIIGGKLIKRWLYRYLRDNQFYDTRLPIKIVAYDLQNRQELVYESGRLIDAVRKSISIPGVLEPVVEKERVIIDGGVLNPVPTNVLRNSGVDRIIAVNVLQSPDEVVKGSQIKKTLGYESKKTSFLKSPMTFIKQRMFMRGSGKPHPTISDIMVQTLLASEYQLALNAVRDADVMIHPDLSGIKWYELYRVDDLIRRGEEAAEYALPEIQELLKRG